MTEEEFEFIGYSPSGGNIFIYVRGTIQEVLNSLSNNMLSAGNVRWWTDDDINAECIYCRIK